MDKTNISFFKFVCKILLLILLIPIKIVKYFCLGFFYSFYVLMELILNCIIFISFTLYKSLKYVCFAFAFPVVILNMIKRKSEFKNIKEDEIVLIPDNALERTVVLNNNDYSDVNDNILLSEKIEMIPEVDEEPLGYQISEPELLKEDNNIKFTPEKVSENKITLNIAEPIVQKEELRTVKNMTQKKHFTWSQLLLPLELISYPVYKLFKYIILGFITVLRYWIKGFIVASFYVYKLCKYLLFSLGFIVMIYNIFTRINADKRNLKAKLRLEKIRTKKEIQFKEKLAVQQQQENKLRDELKKKQEKEENDYFSKKPEKEKKSLQEKINDFLNGLFSLPKVIINKIKHLLTNSVFAKYYRNKKDMSRQVLLIDFAGEDAEKNDIKVLYQYTAKDVNGKIVTDYFEAYSKVEVHSFLLSEGYEVYNIKTNKWIQFAHKSSAISKTKVKNKDLIFFLTQLSTYIKAGIPLVESLKILTRQYSKNKPYQKLFRTIIYDLTMGENFSTALEKQKDAFPRILINMVKASELTGELPEVLDDMAEYFTEIEQTRKQMITALMYPIIILVFAIAVIIFILVWVIPQFVDIYSSMDSAQIPQLTLVILSISNYLKKNYLFIIIVVALVVTIVLYLYKNVKVFRTLAQWLFMHMPVIGNVIIYNEVTVFTKTFSSLLSHNVFITDSMNILNKVTNNEIYKMIILDTITNLAKGEKISKSFENHWAFPIPAYEMLVTGEKTGQLPEMMKKVSEYYQDLHKNSVTRIKTFIEPILIVFLTIIVGIIVLAIVVPMFNLYQSVQGLS